jgi:DNA repair exonuclease SbcCD ATPase subunit
MNPEDVKNQITKLESEKQSYQEKLSDLVVVEPKEFYEEEKHDKVKDEYKVVNNEKIRLETVISGIEKLKSSVKGGIKCEHCGIELMNAAITQQKISELDDLIKQKDQQTKRLSELVSMEQQFIETKKQFDIYEKNKLVKEKYELTIEGCDLKITTLNTKLEKWNEVQDKILKNKKIEEQLIKADLRLEELNREKNRLTNLITTSEYNITSKQEKIKHNEDMILKIRQEEEKDIIYKIYLEAFGKNGLSKTIMKTMMPLINSELQRLMEDSSDFKLEIRINDKNEVEFVMIDNGTGVEKLMVSGSGYEKTIASLALRSVLSKICSLPKPNVIVFDEVFGKIANDNLELVAEFFIKIKDYFDKIFVISHNPLVNQWADTTIKITKEDNVSKILR